MTTATLSSKTALPGPGSIAAIFLTGLISFQMGQNLPDVPLDTPSVSTQEEWHGNVRRSDWGQQK